MTVLDIRAARQPAHPETVRDARDPRRPASPGPRRRTRPPRVPAGPLPRRDHPPRCHAMTRRLRRAHFDEQTTLEEFDFAASPKLPAAQIRDLAALRWLHAGESVILHGPVGVGKTHVAQALGHLAIRHGADVRFSKTSRVLAHLAGGHADRSWARRLAELVRPDLLILDDFAMRELTAQPSRRPLRTHQRTRPDRPVADHHLEPHPARLVSAVPQPRRRRIPARPAHQHQPPSLHERTQLPTQQATRARRPPGHHERQVEIHHGPAGGIT